MKGERNGANLGVYGMRSWIWGGWIEQEIDQQEGEGRVCLWDESEECEEGRDPKMGEREFSEVERSRRGVEAEREMMFVGG